jgi:DNA repair exonuclease SbcCD nuclease subunit
MSIWFFSDPHLGLVRTSHTTVQSRAALKQELFRVAARLIEITGSDQLFCLGDLFDTDTNDEATILQGAEIIKRCTMVLGGNHDLPNREGKLSSLQLLDQVIPHKIVCGSTDEPGFGRGINPAVYFVPHMATQELFEQSLGEARADADSLKGAYPGSALILCLHCNYNSGLIHNDASLNLTREKADELLSSFDYILLGHEHESRTLHGGKLIILGNTHPTSFSDISDKYIWEFEDGKFTPHMIWSKQAGYRNIDWEAGTGEISDTVQFIEITGKAPAERLPDIAQNIAKLWKTHTNLLMVRNNVESDISLPEVDVAVSRTMDLPSRISHALADSDLLSIWNHYVEVAQ